MKKIILSLLAGTTTVLIILVVLYIQSIKCESTGIMYNGKILMQCNNGSTFYLEKEK